MEYREKDGPVIEIVNPVRSGKEIWGVLRLIYTLMDLEREIEISKKEIETEANRMIHNSVFTSLGFMAGCLIIVIVLSSRFLSPLIHLTHLARKLSKGEDRRLWRQLSLRHSSDPCPIGVDRDPDDL